MWRWDFPCSFPLLTPFSKNSISIYHEIQYPFATRSHRLLLLLVAIGTLLGNIFLTEVIILRFFSFEHLIHQFHNPHLYIHVHRKHPTSLQQGGLKERKEIDFTCPLSFLSEGPNIHWRLYHVWITVFSPIRAYSRRSSIHLCLMVNSLSLAPYNTSFAYDCTQLALGSTSNHGSNCLRYMNSYHNR